MAEEKKEVMKVGQDVDIINMETDVLAIAEKRSTMLKRFIELSLKHTNKTDWVDQNGKPYLTASGSEKIARLFGVKVHSVNYRKVHSQDDRGDFYIYEYTGVAELPSKFDSIEAVGTCTSRDVFFAKKGQEWRKLSEIDESNIMKAAYSNLLVNAITRLLGIRNMTWEQVEVAGVFKRSDVQKVEYQNGGKVGGYLISDAQGKRLYAKMRDAKVGDDILKEYLKKNYGIESKKDIKREWYDMICQWVDSQKGLKPL
jgi:hypothetical protein